MDAVGPSTSTSWVQAARTAGRAPIGEVVGTFTDPGVVDPEVGLGHLVGVVAGRSPDAADELLDLVFDPDAGLDVVERLAFVLGALAEREQAGDGGFCAHPLHERYGPAWSILGHLVSADLIGDPGLRALFLLGVALERSGTPLDAAVVHLVDEGWQMSRGERALVLLLAITLRPTLAIDAGTFLGRSAAGLARFAQRVITIDRGPERAAGVADLANVEFRAGLAADVLAEVLAAHPEVELVVLDADHTEAGIVEEVRAVLDHPGETVRAVLVHDAAMASCRRGLASIAWEQEPSVRGASLDFMLGAPGDDGELAGGIALIWVVAPEAPLSRG